MEENQTGECTERGRKIEWTMVGQEVGGEKNVLKESLQNPVFLLRPNSLLDAHKRSWFECL